MPEPSDMDEMKKWEEAPARDADEEDDRYSVSDFWWILLVVCAVVATFIILLARAGSPINIGIDFAVLVIAIGVGTGILRWIGRSTERRGSQG